MRRFIPCIVLLALVASAPVHAETSVSVGITLGNAPPPPAIVFQAQPHLVQLTTTGVWYYGGPCEYDYFRYGMSYYIYNRGYWYRAPHARGPFVAIHESYVPRVFYGLNDRGYRWRHGWKQVPPGRYKNSEHGERGHEHGHEGGHGHGHGHDKD